MIYLLIILPLWAANIPTRCVKPFASLQYGFLLTLTHLQTELLYNSILALVKTSILLFLLRLTGQKKSVRQAIWGLLFFNGITAVVTLLITVFHCLPIAANWNAVAYPDAKCLKFADFVTGRPQCPSSLMSLC